MNLDTKIKSLYPNFTKSERIIADFFIARPSENFLETTLEDLANIIGVGQSTIIRFFKKCGFTNYRSFMLEFSNNSYIRKLDKRAAYRDVDTALYQSVFEQVKVCFASLKEEDLYNIAHEIIKSSLVICIGIGYSRHVASLCSYRLSRNSILSIPIDESGLKYYPDSLPERTKAMVIAFSTRGESTAVIDAMKKFKEKGLYILLLTAHINSTAAQFADKVLFAPSDQSYVTGKEVNIDGIINQIMLIESIIIKCCDISR